MSDALPPDAQVTELSPVEHIYLRVDPTDPANAIALSSAFQEALDKMQAASDLLLDARYALLSAGYRDVHPMCKDIDTNLVTPIAGRLEFVRRNRIERGWRLVSVLPRWDEPMNDMPWFLRVPIALGVLGVVALAIVGVVLWIAGSEGRAR